MIAFLAMPLVKWAGGILIAGLLLGGAYVWITTGAYNRGVAATVAKMQVLIEKGAANVKADLDKLKTLPEDKLDEELRRLCNLHKKPEQTCAP